MRTLQTRGRFGNACPPATKRSSCSLVRETNGSLLQYLHVQIRGRHANELGEIQRPFLLRKDLRLAQDLADARRRACSPGRRVPAALYGAKHAQQSASGAAAHAAGGPSSAILPASTAFSPLVTSSDETARPSRMPVTLCVCAAVCECECGCDCECVCARACVCACLRVCVLARACVCCKVRVRLRVCMSACVRARVSLRGRACECMHRAHARICACVHVCTSVLIRVHVRACVRASVRACLRACVCSCQFSAICCRSSRPCSMHGGKTLLPPQRGSRHHFAPIRPCCSEWSQPSRTG